jgi:hypothetical protein
MSALCKRSFPTGLPTPTHQVIEVIGEVFNLTGTFYQGEYQAHVDKAMNTPEARQSNTAQGVNGVVAAHAHADQGSTQFKRHLLLPRYWPSPIRCLLKIELSLRSGEY